MAEPGRLALETGRCFGGLLLGAEVTDAVSGEVVFNTCMTGYQEVVTDPSYAGQVVVMTHPLIGNYGCRDSDAESGSVWARAMVVRELSPQVGHPRAERSLEEELRRHGVPGLCGADTRALTRHLRERGAMRVGISSELRGGPGWEEAERVLLARRQGCDCPAVRLVGMPRAPRPAPRALSEPAARAVSRDIGAESDSAFAQARDVALFTVLYG